MHYLKIIRFPNLLILAWVQGLIQFAVLPVFNGVKPLSTLHFILLTTATLCLAAGGYVINDIKDVAIDRINKPKKNVVESTLSRKRASSYYYLLTTLGIILGSTLSIVRAKPPYALLFIGVAGFLYVYASKLKARPFVGNLLVSVLIALSILLVPIFTYSHSIAMWEITRERSGVFIFCVAVFSGLLTLLRELVKDLEDIQGDYNAGLKTLPILLGIERTAYLSASIGFTIVFSLALLTFTVFKGNILLQGVLFTGVILPLAYVSSIVWNGRQKQLFSRSSLFLKLIMLSGSFMIPFLAQHIAYAPR